VGLVLLPLLLRVPTFFPIGLIPDEGLYMLQAREWLRGGWPYVAVWDMHPLGAPALFAGAFALLGESVFSIRLLGVVSVAATGAVLMMMVRAAGGERVVGLAAGVIYVGHSLLMNGTPTNTEILFAPFVALAWMAAVAACRRVITGGAAPGWRDMLLMGLPMGLALLIKSVVVMEGCAAFLLVVAVAWRHAALPLGRLAAIALCYAAACAAPTLLAGLPYLVQGQLDAYVNANFVAPRLYMLDTAVPAEAIRQTAIAILSSAWPIVLGLLGIIMALRAGRRLAGGPSALLLPGAALLWLTAATLGILVMGKFYDHYFLTWLPPLALLGALGARGLSRFMRPGPVGLAFAVLVAAGTAMPWASSVSERFRTGFGFRNPVQDVAHHVAAAINPGDLIYVVNMDPIIYVLAKAAIPTPYAFSLHLADQADSKVAHVNPAMIDQDAEVGRVLASRPRAIVVHRGLWGSLRPDAAAQIGAVLKSSYNLSDTVAAAGGTVEIWRLR
jgi:hypothetical protein